MTGQVLNFREWAEKGNAANQQKQELQRKMGNPVSNRQTKTTIGALGEVTLMAWEAGRGRIVNTDGDSWSYDVERGYWNRFDRPMIKILKSLIIEVCSSLEKAPNTGNVANVVQYITHHPDRMAEDVAWDASNLIACANGTLDPVSRDLRDHSQFNYLTKGIGTPFVEGARCPRWLAFLNESFADLDPDEAGHVIATLGEWVGAALVGGKSREMTRALFLYGPSRTGKTVKADIVTALMGVNRVSAMSLSDLARNFGMASLLNAVAWISNDAIRKGEKVDAEALKKVITGERVSISRKFLDDAVVSLDLPVLLTANALPRVNDTTSAVYNRSIIVPMNVVVSEVDADGRLAQRIIAEELPGILNWALDGYARLSIRGYFDLPMTLKNALDEFEDDNNPYQSWMAECLEEAPGCRVDNRDIVACMHAYLASHGDDTEFKAAGIHRSIRARFPRARAVKSNGQRQTAGVRITEAGLDYLDERRKALFGRVVGSGCGRLGVNQPDSVRPSPHEDDVENF